MINDYTPKHFLRLAEKTLLKEYFAKQGMLAELDWNALGEGEIEPIYAAWQMLPEAKQEAVESLHNDLQETA